MWERNMTTEFVGTWKLLSAEARLADGTVIYPYGRSPVGRLSYDAAGHMSAQLNNSQRPAFATADKASGTPQEVQAAIETYESYYGTYEVDEAAQIVVHHVHRPNAVLLPISRHDGAD
jgi:hypothetical protein